MIIIHKTFSKKEIIKFLGHCGIVIEQQFNKQELKEYLTKFFQKDFNKNTLIKNKYGYLSSVRKAIKYYNYLDLDHINYLNCDNSNNNKKDIKYNMKKGKYIISF